jgi:hypothetical protein
MRASFLFKRHLCKDKTHYMVELVLSRTILCRGPNMCGYRNKIMMCVPIFIYGRPPRGIAPVDMGFTT